MASFSAPAELPRTSTDTRRPQRRNPQTTQSPGRAMRLQSTPVYLGDEMWSLILKPKAEKLNEDVHFRKRPPEAMSYNTEETRRKLASNRPIVLLDFNKNQHTLVIAKQNDDICYLPIDNVNIFQRHFKFILGHLRDLTKDIWIHVNEATMRTDWYKDAIEMLVRGRESILEAADLFQGSFPIQVLTIGSHGTKSVSRPVKTSPFLKHFFLKSLDDGQMDNFFKTHHFNRLRRIEGVLTVPDEGVCQLWIQLKPDVPGAATADGGPSYLEQAYSALREVLEDPHSRVRQQFQHAYTIPNLHVLEMIGEKPQRLTHPKTYLCVELRPLTSEGVRLLSQHETRGTLCGMLEENIKIRGQLFQGHVATQIRNSEHFSKGFSERLSDSFNLNLLQLDQPQNSVPPLQGTIVAQWYQEMLQDRKKTPYDFLQLVKGKVPVNILTAIRNNQDENALHMAVIAERSDFLQMWFFLDHWGTLRQDVITNPNGSHTGYTPRRLAEALAFKSKGLAVLEEYDFWESTYLRLSVLSKACLAGKLDVVKILVEADNRLIHEDEQHGTTALFLACGAGHADIVQHLIAKGARLTVSNFRNESCSHIAAMFGHIDVLRVLSNYKFDIIGQRDASDMNAMECAVKNGNLQMLQFFNEMKFPLRSKLLTLAVKYMRTNMFDFLNQHVDINSGEDKDGRTALHYSVIENDQEAMNALVQLKVDITKVDKTGKNVFHIAAANEKCDRVIFDTLIQYSRDVGVLPEMINSHDFYTGKDLYYLVRGKDKGRRAWHWVQLRRLYIKLFKDALGRGQVDVANHGEIIFSGFGASPGEAINNQIKERQEEALLPENRMPDLTPLHHATRAERFDIVQILLLYGADPNAADYFGATPVHYAITTGNLEILTELQRFGGDLQLLTNDGKSCSELASENGHPNIMNFLEGNPIIDQTSNFVMDAVRSAKQDLCNDTLMAKRADGQDLKRHVIDSLRNLQIDINKFLLSLGSGPIQEASQPEGADDKYTFSA